MFVKNKYIWFSLGPNSLVHFQQKGFLWVALKIRALLISHCRERNCREEWGCFCSCLRRSDCTEETAVTPCPLFILAVVICKYSLKMPGLQRLQCYPVGYNLDLSRQSFLNGLFQNFIKIGASVLEGIQSIWGNFLHLSLYK